MSDKITTRELLDMNSSISSMRWAFVLTVKVALLISVLAVIGVVTAAILGKTLDISAIIALVVGLLTVAFGGKSVQSFSEKKPPVIPTSAPEDPTVTK